MCLQSSIGLCPNYSAPPFSEPATEIPRSHLEDSTRPQQKPILWDGPRATNCHEGEVLLTRGCLTYRNAVAVGVDIGSVAAFPGRRPRALRCCALGARTLR